MFEIRESSIHGLGVHATEDIGAGDWFSIFEKLAHFPTFRGFNHSCTPNCALVYDSMFEALRPIASGEELTVKYLQVPPDSCRCGNCRLTVGPESE